MKSGMAPFSAQATISALKGGGLVEAAPRRLVPDQIFLPPLRGHPEHDFRFLVFGSIGAPNLGALILVKAMSTPARHRLDCTEGTQALNFAIFRDLRGPRAGANNH